MRIGDVGMFRAIIYKGIYLTLAKIRGNLSSLINPCNTDFGSSGVLGCCKTAETRAGHPINTFETPCLNQNLFRLKNRRYSAISIALIRYGICKKLTKNYFSIPTHAPSTKILSMALYSNFTNWWKCLSAYRSPVQFKFKSLHVLPCSIVLRGFRIGTHSLYSPYILYAHG